MAKPGAVSEREPPSKQFVEEGYFYITRIMQTAGMPNLTETMKLRFNYYLDELKATNSIPKNAKNAVEDFIVFGSQITNDKQRQKVYEAQLKVWSKENKQAAKTRELQEKNVQFTADAIDRWNGTVADIREGLAEHFLGGAGPKGAKKAETFEITVVHPQTKKDVTLTYSVTREKDVIKASIVGSEPSGYERANNKAAETYTVNNTTITLEIPFAGSQDIAELLGIPLQKVGQSEKGAVQPRQREEARQTTALMTIEMPSKRDPENNSRIQVLYAFNESTDDLGKPVVIATPVAYAAHNMDSGEAPILRTECRNPPGSLDRLDVDWKVVNPDPVVLADVHGQTFRVYLPKDMQGLQPGPGQLQGVFYAYQSTKK